MQGGILGALIERFFHGVGTSRSPAHCDSNCLKGPSVATIVSQGESLPLQEADFICVFGGNSNGPKAWQYFTLNC